MTKLVLMSGGLDSACLLFHAKATAKEGEIVKALFIDYGQKNVVQERTAAAALCKQWRVEWDIVEVPRLFKGVQSSILRTSEDVHTVGKDELINRNAILISIAASRIVGKGVVWVGAHKGSTDYPDTIPAFYTRINRLTFLSTHCQVEVEAPFIRMTKYALVKLAYEEGMERCEMEMTVSCYEGNNCNHCPACKNRREVLEKIFY